MHDWLVAAAILASMAIVLGSLVWVGLWIRKRWFGQSGLVRKKLLTGNELDFYRKLLQAASPRFTVLAQVSMGALVDTTLKPAHSDYWKVRQQFALKICDFVLCDPKTMTPVLIVELDDVMHDFNKDAQRDSITGLAGYQTLRFWSRNKPSVEELRLQISLELALTV